MREQLRGATDTATDTRRVASDANVQLRDLAFKVVKEKVFLVLVILFINIFVFQNQSQTYRYI